MTTHVIFKNKRVLTHRIIAVEFKISHVLQSPKKLYGLFFVKIRTANVCLP